MYIVYLKLHVLRMYCNTIKGWLQVASTSKHCKYLRPLLSIANARKNA